MFVEKGWDVEKQDRERETTAAETEASSLAEWKGLSV